MPDSVTAAKKVSRVQVSSEEAKPDLRAMIAGSQVPTPRAAGTRVWCARCGCGPSGCRDLAVEAVAPCERCWGDGPRVVRSAGHRPVPAINYV